MSFFTDIQTRQDLNLVDRYSNKSVYAIFNDVKTPGASRLLEKMFNHPLTDHEAINARSTIFNSFEALDIDFCVEEEAISAADAYLQSGGKGRFSSLLDISRLFGLKLIGVPAEYDLRMAQLQAVFKFCHQLKQLISRILDSGQQIPIAKALKDALNFLNTEISRDLQPEAEEISLARLAAYDRLFRVQANQRLLDLIDLAYHLDLYLAVSSVSRKKSFTYALALQGNENILSITDCRNPLVKFAKGNSISIAENKNVMFLTGANMAGKSTFMKSVGITLYLAHMGFPVPAAAMHFSVKDGLYTSINISDNLEQGYSHFYAEVRRVKDVAQAVASSKRLFVIFDELFKGTNVKDAYDATLAVTQAFAKYKQCGFIISTHIIEVTQELGVAKDNIQFFYLPTVMNGKIPVYTYNLIAGVSDDRHGMVLIQKEGILEMLA